MKTKLIISIIILTLALFLSIPNAYSAWTVDKTSINFGNVPVGTSKTDTIVITNTGATPLEFSFYPSMPEITTDVVGNTPVGGGASITLVITFTPTTRGNYTGEVLIASDDPNTPSRTITITAVSTYATGIDVLPLSINFGSVTIGYSKSEALRIGNNGTSILNVIKIEITKGTPFTVSETQFIIRPGEVKTLTVTYSPTQKGSYSAALSIISDDRNTPKVVVSLSGDTGTEFPLQFYPSIMNFGSVVINSSSERLIKLQNISQYIIDVSLNIYNVIGSSFSFPTGTMTSFALVPGEIRQVPIRFSPTTKTDYSALLYINTTTGTARISLIGTGSETGTAGLVTQNPPPSSGGGGGGGCSISRHRESSYFGNALLMFAPLLAVFIKKIYRKIKK